MSFAGAGIILPVLAGKLFQFIFGYGFFEVHGFIQVQFDGFVRLHRRYGSKIHILIQEPRRVFC